jgi:hypothetical protein
MQHVKYVDINWKQFSTYPTHEPKAHMFTAAAWMFKMTGDKAYSQKASAYHAQVCRVVEATLGGELAYARVSHLRTS